LHTPIVVPQKPPRSDPSGRNDSSEFQRFDGLLNRLLKVPHSKIKAELDAEKRRPKKQKRRASVGHAYRDTD